MQLQSWCQHLPATELQDFDKGGYAQTNLPFRSQSESLQHPLTDVVQRERSSEGGQALWLAASGIVDRWVEGVGDAYMAMCSWVPQGMQRPNGQRSRVLFRSGCRETTSLALLDSGGKGWTAFHIDRSEAWNLLLLVGKLIGEASAAKAMAAANAAAAAVVVASAKTSARAAASAAAAAAAAAKAAAAAAKAAAAAGAAAEWLLFHPAAASEASDLWKAVGGAPNGFNTAKENQKKVSELLRGSVCGRRAKGSISQISHDQMFKWPCVQDRWDAFVAAVTSRFDGRTAPGTGEPLFRHVWQVPGDMVWVPPGWVHAVRNLKVSHRALRQLLPSQLCAEPRACLEELLADPTLGVSPTPQRHQGWSTHPPNHPPPTHVHLPTQPCVKIAWDGFQWEHMPAYAEQGHAVGARLTAAANGVDYMAVAPVAAAALLRMKLV